MATDRMRRVNEEIKEILAARLLELKDPRIGFVTLTDVRTSPDLAQAEVFYTELDGDEGNEPSETAAGLESAAPMLRRELADRLRIRRIPELHFTHDPAPERGRHIERLLRQARERDRE